MRLLKSTAHSPTSSVKDFYSRTKNIIPDSYKSNLMYCITCAICSKNYVGQTSQYVKKHVYQQEYSFKINNYNHTAVTDHTLDTGHLCGFSRVSILHRKPVVDRRLILELCYISMCSNSLTYTLTLEVIFNLQQNTIRYFISLINSSWFDSSRTRMYFSQKFIIWVIWGYQLNIWFVSTHSIRLRGVAKIKNCFQFVVWRHSERY